MLVVIMYLFMLIIESVFGVFVWGLLIVIIYVFDKIFIQGWDVVLFVVVGFLFGIIYVMEVLSVLICMYILVEFFCFVFGFNFRFV